MNSRRGPARLFVTAMGLLIFAGAGYAQIQPSKTQSSSAWAMQESPNDGGKSSWIALGTSGAVGTPDGPELRLSVSNRKTEPLELRVTFKTPGRKGDCVVTKTLAPSGKIEFACHQDSLLPEKTYPVTIEVFKQGKQKRVERVRLSYRFGRDDIARLEERIAKMRPGR